MNIRIVYKKTGMIKYISHLDTLRLFHRAMRREQIPIEFSKGFNPHMMLSLANPLPLGVESEVEFMDMVTTEDVDIASLIEQINSILPEGLSLIRGAEFERGSVNEKIRWSAYEFNYLKDRLLSEEQVETCIQELLSRETITIKKKMKKHGKKVIGDQEVRPFIREISFLYENKDFFVISAILRTASDGGLNPIEFSKIFNDFSQASDDVNSINIKRTRQFTEDGTDILETL